MSNLLANPGFEGGWWRETHTGQPYGEIFVPEHWVAYWNEQTDVPHDPSNLVGYGRPEMHVISREPPFLDPPRVRSSSQATKFFTFYRIHDAGLYQQVSGIGPGVRLRGTGWAHAWSSTDDNPWTSDGAGSQPCFLLASECNPEAPTFEAEILNVSFRVGIDPQGGTDPWSDRVIWGEAAYIYNAYAQVPPVEAIAESDSVTFFVRSSVLWPFKHCDAYLDDMRMTVVAEPPSPLEVTVTPQKLIAGEPFEVSASGGLGPASISIDFSDERVFQKEVRIVDRRAACRCVAVAAGEYEVRIASGTDVVHHVVLKVHPADVAAEPGIVPPREAYERTYVLLPPGASSDWLRAVRESGAWDRYRWTVGGSADDAGIGPPKRRVIAVNPQYWVDDLRTFFDRYYPGVEYIPVTASTPGTLTEILRRL